MTKRCVLVSVAVLMSSGIVFARPAGPRPSLGKSGDKIIPITQSMVINNESPSADPWFLFDNPTTVPDYIPWASKDKKYPVSCYVDLGGVRMVSNLYIYPLNAIGKWDVFYGSPGNWLKASSETTQGHKQWRKIPLEVKTRYLRFVLVGPGARIGEMVICENPDAKYTNVPGAVLRARRKAEKARRDAEAALKILTYAETLPKTADAGSVFGELPLIDEVNCSDPDDPHLLKEHVKGDSVVKTILGRKCRTLPKRDRPAYFGYRMGQGLGLKAGKAYLLAVDYPEDVSRTIWVQNFGSETNKGFATGQAIGDTLYTFTNNNPESLKYPLSGKYRTWYAMFYLHDRTSETGGARTLLPKDGFSVLFSQPGQIQQPLSAGAAISRIRLFAIPQPEKLYQPLNFPPKELPHRYLFDKQEMGFGVINSVDIKVRGCDKVEDWYEYKMRLQKFLGMNVFCKTLLMFGIPQGWDVNEGKGGRGWYRHHKFPKNHRRLLALSRKYGLEYLPYYEYSAGQGPGSLGVQRRVRPLGRDKYYTHVKWTERRSANLTDPDTLKDAKRLLDFTITRHLGKGDFMGVFFRTRLNMMPISFTDADIARFEKDKKIAPCPTCGGSMVNRKQIKADKKLYKQYRDWWNKKRLAFIEALRSYLIEKGIKDPQVLFSSFHTEPGPSLISGVPGKGVVLSTDDVATWKKILAGNKKHANIAVLDIRDITKRDMYNTALTKDRRTWDDWEWHHADPPADPDNYRQAMVTQMMAFNRSYTVASPEQFKRFTSRQGQGLVRHYPLNEHTTGKIATLAGIDVERSGANCMFAEARAMANGNPRYIGYLSAQVYQRGFPEYVRKFNAAFLSLPALPATVVPKAASDSDVVVKEIKADKYGTYYAVVNTSFSPKRGVTVKLPAGGKIINAATGKATGVSGNELTLDFTASELKSFLVK